MTPTIGVIVPTYERPEALRAVLRALEAQTYRRFEVVVADDGSGPATRELVERFQGTSDLPLHHVWQEDSGFRAGAIRNRAIAATSGEYLVMLDGDCVVRPSFLKRHARLAERGFFVRGKRIRLSRALTEEVLNESLPIHDWGILRWYRLYRDDEIDQFEPVLSLPLGPFRKTSPPIWTRVESCNLGVWRDEVIEINGFNEEYVGWGFEDCDLVMRLIRAGARRKEGRYSVPVFHLWHELSTDPDRNEALFNEHLNSKVTRIECGVDQYL